MTYSSDSEVGSLHPVRTAASALAESIRTEEKKGRKKKGLFRRRDERRERERRHVYVNQPLPVLEMDANGEPVVSYVRNKVRTTKYTILSFIPKNLFEQFRRAANLLFLVLAIVQLFPVFGSASGPIAVLPLAFILTVTAIKDGIEDYRRATLDEQVNTSAVTHLAGGWRNQNQPSDPRNWFEKFLGLHRPGSVSKGVRKLREKEANQAGLDIQDILNSTRLDVQSDHSYPPSTLNKLPAPSIASTSTLPASHNVLSSNPQISGTALWERTLWKKLVVGDIVLLSPDSQIPADILVLSTSSPDGLCYVETKNLDGETNLKPRRSIKETSLIRSEEDIERAKFWVDAEAPHADLYTFHGVLHYSSSSGKSTSVLSINNLLLRGCMLRNTAWVIGLVVYTGSDTKIMLNGGETPSKRSKIEKETNFNVVVNFVILSIMCLVSAIANGEWQTRTDTSAAFFEINSEPTRIFFVNGVVTLVSCLIAFQNIVPISLYISIEIVKTIQAYFISQDVDLYYQPYDTACVPKTWNISDDLGQIEYIFSDKTGTLTQNVMEFLKCSIGGVVYGEGITEAQRGSVLRNPRQSLGPGPVNELLSLDKKELEERLGTMKSQMLSTFSRSFKNRFLQIDKLTLISPKLAEDLAFASAGAEQKERIVEFFRALAICHTVLAERPPSSSSSSDGLVKLEYKAESPDEAALVAAARDVGVAFVSKLQDTLTIDVLGRQEIYTVLKVIEFDSTRKRMSVIVRNDSGKIIVYSKGADSVIYARLDTTSKTGGFEGETKKDMEKFANEGLRTLAIAKREVSESLYQSFSQAFDAAQVSSSPSRDADLAASCEIIECSLSILGATALEDKLQEGVPDAIDTLHKAGIKLWILTGDKLQTAIEIGYSCNLIKPDMEVLIISAESSGETRGLIESGLNRIAEVRGYPSVNPHSPKGRKVKERGFVKKDGEGGGFAVVIDGDTLKYALEDELKGLFLDLGTECETVVCCRVSPAQKALTVKLVKEGRDAMTLSIGDGANDVAMIQEANIGCGLFGLEGSQAAMSADYAFGQFRFLVKLLLVHGRWSYQRVADMHSNFFYKNVIWTFGMFWYLIFNNFDATYLYQYTFILLCNLVFTSLPVIVLGAFDQDLNAKAALAFPQLYLRGIRGLEYTRTKFWFYMSDGLYQSAVVFFIPYLVWTLGNTTVSWNGRGIESLSELGTTVAVAAIFAANSYVGISTHYWTIITWISVFGSTVVMLLWIVVYSFWFSSDFYYEVVILFGELTFWTTVVFAAIVALAPRYVVKYISTVYFPLDKDIIREMWVKGDLKDQLGIRHRRQRTKNLHKLEEGSESEASSAGSTGGEAVPMMLQTASQSHLRSVSEAELGYERTLTGSPGPGVMAGRQTYLETPPMSSGADSTPIPGNGPPQFVYTKSGLDQELRLSPHPPGLGTRHMMNPSPNPSYYSASEIPIPSPLPSPKYMLSSGEITSSPPPPSRRTSVATTIKTSPIRQSSQSQQSQSSLQIHAPSPSRQPISNNAYEMRVRSPPTSYRHLEPTPSEHSRHGNDRSTSAASWTTANDEYYSAEDGDGYEPATFLQATPNPNYHNKRTSEISWDGGRAV